METVWTARGYLAVSLSTTGICSTALGGRLARLAEDLPFPPYRTRSPRGGHEAAPPSGPEPGRVADEQHIEASLRMGRNIQCLIPSFRRGPDRFLMVAKR